MDTNKNYYTGVGSRQTPTIALEVMKFIASDLLMKNYILRSGGAGGADSAFESVIPSDDMKEIYIPWKKFNNRSSTLYPPSEDAYNLASSIHPSWNKLSKARKLLHARNCHQVLGYDLTTPSRFLICWTTDGRLTGGTSTAIKIAMHNDIPILNLGTYITYDSMIESYKDFLILNGENI